MKSVMYHYVRPAPEDMPWFRYLHLDDFRRQLDFFEQEDRFIGKSEFSHILSTHEVPEDGIILTFDDGFRDHYDWVLPELLERKLWGIFFVPTGIYRRRKLLNVHRVHCLIGIHGGVKILDALGGLIHDDMLTHAHVEDFRTLTYRHQDNDEATTAVKRILNYFIGDEHRGVVLDELCARYLDEEALYDRFYMTVEMLKEMQNRGMLVGAHSVNHSVLSTLSEEEQQRELSGSLEFLCNCLGEQDLLTFCYPYGGFHTFSDSTERELSQLGCACCFNVESRNISEHDVRCRPQALPRFDCNKFPYGRSSLGNRW